MHKSYILHIASWYPSQVNTFDGDFIQRHIESITNHDHIVIHAQEINGNNNLVDHGEATKKVRNNIEEHIIYYKPTIRLLNPFYQYFYLYRLWKRVYTKRGLPILIHLHVILYGILLARSIKRRYHIPVVATEHSTLYTSVENIPFRKLRINMSRYLSSIVNVIMPVSNHLAKALRKHGFKNEIEVVHNVVPVIFAADTLDKPDGKVIKFLHVSSLDNHQKNISGILAAAQKLLDINDKFELTIVGNYNLDATQAIIDTCTFEKGQVMLRGPLSHHEVAEVMKAHDVFVLFSNYENYPCVLIEAQTANMSLIATDVGGVSEILNNNRDILIDKNDIKALQVAMSMYINNSEYKAIGSYNFDVITKYSPNNIGDQIVGIYNKVQV